MLTNVLPINRHQNRTSQWQKELYFLSRMSNNVNCTNYFFMNRENMLGRKAESIAVSEGCKLAERIVEWWKEHGIVKQEVKGLHSIMYSRRWHLPSPKNELYIVSLLLFHRLWCRLKKTPWTVAQIVSVISRRSWTTLMMLRMPTTCKIIEHESLIWKASRRRGTVSIHAYHRAIQKRQQKP